MKKKRLRSFVLPTLYVMIIAVTFLSISFLSKALNGTNFEKYDFVMSAFKKNILPVVSEVGDTVKSPINNENVTISKSFYDMNDDETVQQNSLIYYEKTYMENTGILYVADEKFDCLATMDGVIKNIKEDDILGNVVEVENNSRVTTIYYSLGDIAVKVGDNVTSGTVIGTSGKNKLENEKENCLLFEVYLDGNLINPNNFFGMNLADLN